MTSYENGQLWQARKLAQKYRDAYCAAHAAFVAQIEDETDDEQKVREQRKKQECALPWERK